VFGIILEKFGYGCNILGNFGVAMNLCMLNVGVTVLRNFVINIRSVGFKS
jgi:hypothetical protein